MLQQAFITPRSVMATMAALPACGMICRGIPYGKPRLRQFPRPTEIH
jgi:hypothetical protein